MKFGKSIRNETHKNTDLIFINFKHLKHVLKIWTDAALNREWTKAFQEDFQFRSLLESELERVRKCFKAEMQEILVLQTLIQKGFPLLDLRMRRLDYSTERLEKFQASTELTYQPEDSSQNALLTHLIHISKDSVALSDFCVNLGKISARCKRLRHCVLWNAVAIVKIMKKRKKNLEQYTIQKASISPMKSAAQILSQQEWYRSLELARVVSIVDTTTDTLMQQLTGVCPRREQYECPICLDVIVDPVSLRTCGHRFCWACLCMAYCEKSEGALERCPYCRAAFPLDPDAFIVDGILSRFLKTFFPETQSCRLREQRESLRYKFEQLYRPRKEVLEQRDDQLKPKPSTTSPLGERSIPEDPKNNFFKYLNCDISCTLSGESKPLGGTLHRSNKPHDLLLDSVLDSSKIPFQKETSYNERCHYYCYTHDKISLFCDTSALKHTATQCILDSDVSCKDCSCAVVECLSSPSQGAIALDEISFGEETDHEFFKESLQIQKKTCVNSSPTNGLIKYGGTGGKGFANSTTLNILDSPSLKGSFALSLLSNSFTDSNSIDDKKKNLPCSSVFSLDETKFTSLGHHPYHNILSPKRFCDKLDRHRSEISVPPFPKVNRLISSFLDLTSFERYKPAAFSLKVRMSNTTHSIEDKLKCSDQSNSLFQESEILLSYSIDEAIDEEDDEIEEEFFNRKMENFGDVGSIESHLAFYSSQVFFE